MQAVVAHVNELPWGPFLIVFVACDRLIKRGRSYKGKLPKAEHNNTTVVAGQGVQVMFYQDPNLEALSCDYHHTGRNFSSGLTCLPTKALRRSVSFRKFVTSMGPLRNLSYLFCLLGGVVYGCDLVSES